MIEEKEITLNEVLEFLPQIPNEIKRLKDVVDGSR